MITVILLTMCFASNLLLGEEMKFVEDRISKSYGNVLYESCISSNDLMFQNVLVTLYSKPKKLNKNFCIIKIPVELMN